MGYCPTLSLFSFDLGSTFFGGVFAFIFGLGTGVRILDVEVGGEVVLDFAGAGETPRCCCCLEDGVLDLEAERLFGLGLVLDDVEAVCWCCI